MAEERDDIKNVSGPPFFKSWKGMYIFLLGFLLFQIIVYYLITILL